MASDAGKHALTDEDRKKGAYVREETKFRGTIVADPKQADIGKRVWPAEKGRYHLYVSLACPWAHRTLITCALKGLHDFSKNEKNLIGSDGKNVATGEVSNNIIHVNVVHPYLRFFDTPAKKIGWEFRNNIKEDDEKKDSPETYFPGNFNDPLNHKDNLWQIYDMSWKLLKNDETVEYPKRYITVPCLFDSKTNQIINNESAEIIEILNVAFNEFIVDDSQKTLNLSPSDDATQATMKEINDWVYPNINDGVYRCGFASKQAAYNEAYASLFEHLDKLEEILSEKDREYAVLKDALTLSDIRIFTTLLRFDPVYYTHFKCNKRTIRSYPNIWNYVKRIYALPGVKDTCDIDQIKYHYFYSHVQVNPRQIVPIGPNISFE